MKNKTDLVMEQLKEEGSAEIAKRKRAFQEENRRQMRTGEYTGETSFISREIAIKATFRFKR